MRRKHLNVKEICARRDKKYDFANSDNVISVEDFIKTTSEDSEEQMEALEQLQKIKDSMEMGYNLLNQFENLLDRRLFYAYILKDKNVKQNSIAKYLEKEINEKTQGEYATDINKIIRGRMQGMRLWNPMLEGLHLALKEVDENEALFRNGEESFFSKQEEYLRKMVPDVSDAEIKEFIKAVNANNSVCASRGKSKEES